MRSRKNGEGSYSTVSIKGVIYQRYRYSNGKQIYAKSMKELRQKMDKYEKELKEKPAVTSSDLTLSDVMKMWLKSRYRKIEMTSYDKYENVICNYFSNYRFGNYQITSITPDMLSDFYASLVPKYSFNTISGYQYIIKSSIKYAIANDIIPTFDFSKIVYPSKKEMEVKQKEIRIVSPDDAEKIYKEAMRKYITGEYVHPEVYRLLVFIMYTGLRVGEAIGLQWGDVDKNYVSIRVKRNVGRVKRRNTDGTLMDQGFHTELVYKAPKSEHSYRVIPLPKRAKLVLQTLHREDSKPNETIFKSKKGNMLEYGSVFSAFKILIKDAKCEYLDYTIHGLRHTYGSILIRKGVDIKIVSELLGHKSVSFTYDVYIGVLKEDKIKAIQIFDDDDDE